MNIPIYQAVLNDNLGLQCISAVPNPAMEVEMLLFNKQEKRLNFVVNEELEHCITSVVIKCDEPIYRYDYEIGDYYITFDKKVIKQLIEKYSKDNLLNNFSVHHNGKLIDDVVMVEFFIKDTTKGINPTAEQFKDIKDGSLFCTFKINNNELWNEIKNGNFGGLSMEVVIDIEKTDKNIQEDFNDVDIFEYLFTEDNEKKKFNTSKNEIKKILKKQKQVNITWGAELLENQQIYGTCKVNSENGIMVYNPSNETWTTYNLKEIEVKVTDNPLVDFNYNAQWKLLINDMNIIIDSVKSTSQEGKNSIDYIMDRNMYAMISYFDETEDGATGFRLCFLSSWGETTSKNGGNEAIRIYEYNGDTKSGFDEGRWRLLLTRRIIDIKAVDYMKPIQTPPPLYNGEAKANTGIGGTMSNVKRVAEFPPKIIWQPEK